MKFKGIPTITRQTATVDQRIAWSAPGKTVHKRSRVRALVPWLIVALVFALMSAEGVLTTMTQRAW
jgi:hypothetical protein